MSQSHPVVDPLFLAFQLAVAGRYSIDRELGRGGMGIVYLAREVHLDRLVAIKLLPPERARNASLRHRFLREARLAAKLSHPNIIPIHSVEEAGEFVYYIMAFIDGETLAQRVRTRGPLPSSEAARLLREAAWALAYAHGQGLVHRDVKPDNILLETASGRVLVADFGIAAAAGDNADGISGTPEFMSPEQALGTALDARSDIYGLGATAFYAFSGRFPFEGKTPTEVLAKQVTEPAPQLGSLGMPVPRKLAALVDRCLSKEAGRRPASAQALAEQLGLALEQRRELPVALRAFVKRQARLNGGGTVIAGIALLPLSIAVSAMLGGVAGFGAFFLGAVAAPMAYFTGAARRLLMMGFAHGDIGPAFRAEAEQANEELALEPRRAYLGLEKLLIFLAKVSGGLFVFFGSIFAALELYFTPRLISDFLPVMVGVTFSVAAMSTLGIVALSQRRKDVDTEFWSKVWMGRIGQTVFGLARRLARNRVRETAMTHRATELSLGMAAEQLYESLPKESRQALGNLPQLLQRLQADAQALRKRYDEMQDAIAAAGDASSPEYTEVRELRDAIHAQLGDAVGALETIRLDLLRLHAGSASVESVTTHLGIAAEVSAEVERLIAAHQDVERGLRYPRLPATTPV